MQFTFKNVFIFFHIIIQIKNNLITSDLIAYISLYHNKKKIKIKKIPTFPVGHIVLLVSILTFVFYYRVGL